MPHNTWPRHPSVRENNTYITSSLINWGLSWFETDHFTTTKNMVGWMLLETAPTSSDSNWASPLMAAVKKGSLLNTAPPVFVAIAGSWNSVNEGWLMQSHITQKLRSGTDFGYRSLSSNRSYFSMNRCFLCHCGRVSYVVLPETFKPLTG